MKILKFLFPTGYTCTSSAVLLVARVVFSLLLVRHGWDKFVNFGSTVDHFPAMLGMSSELSLMLCIFAELFCALAVVAGVLTRLALIPIVINMLVAFAVAHGGSVADGEMAFMYLVTNMLLLWAGPGSWSVDGLIAKKLNV